MVDEMFDRDYQSGRGTLNRDIDRGIAGFLNGLRSGYAALNRIQWSAPWPTKAARRRVKRAGMA